MHAAHQRIVPLDQLCAEIGHVELPDGIFPSPAVLGRATVLRQMARRVGCHRGPHAGENLAEAVGLDSPADRTARARVPL